MVHILNGVLAVKNAFESVLMRWMKLEPIIQSESCEIPDWMKHKLESRLLGEILTTSDMQMTSLK